MTPSPRPEPELEAKPVPITDPPKAAADASAPATPDSRPGVANADGEPVTSASDSDPDATQAVPIIDAGAAKKPAAQDVPADEAPIDQASPVEPVEVADGAAAPAEPAIAETRPVKAQPAKIEPINGEPVTDEPATREPVGAKPANGEPVAAQPANGEPTTAEPDPTATEPIKSQPIKSQPGKSVPVKAAPGAPTPVAAAWADKPAADEPLATEPEATEVIVVDEEELGTDDDYRTPPPGTGYSTLVPVVSALVALAALFAVMVAAFALPAVHSQPNHLPIGVSGTPAITAQVKQLFTANGSKAFTVTTYTQESALRNAIKDRKIYGGLSVTNTGASMLISSAASPAAASELGSIASSLSSQSQSQIAVTDVVPLPKKDSRGAGLEALALPLVIGSLLPALLMFELYRRRAVAQLGGAIVASVVLGLVVSAVLTFWIGSTHGSNFFLLGLGLAAGLASTSLILLGLAAIGERIGLAIGAAVILLISAPLSGFTSAPEWLPSPWGTIGRLLPAGAAGTVFRSTAFFHGKGMGSAVLVLAAWAVIGLLLLVLGTALLKPYEPEPTEAELAELKLIEVEPQPAG